MRLVFAAMFAACMVASPASAAILVKNINVSSAFNGYDAAGKQIVTKATFAVPRFDPSLGVLRSISVYLDFVESISLTATRTGSNTSSSVIFLSSTNGINNIDILRFFRAQEPREPSLQFPQYATSASYRVSLPSFSDSRIFAPRELDFVNLLSSGLTIENRYNARDFTTSPASISNFRVRGTGTFSILYDYVLRPVSFSSVSAVPEPATWAMMVIGMAGIGIALRRRARLAVA